MLYDVIKLFRTVYRKTPVWIHALVWRYYVYNWVPRMNKITDKYVNCHLSSLRQVSYWGPQSQRTAIRTWPICSSPSHKVTCPQGHSWWEKISNHLDCLLLCVTVLSCHKLILGFLGCGGCGQVLSPLKTIRVLESLNGFTQKPKLAKKVPQAIQFGEFVSSSEQIWRNLALFYLHINGSSAVNGCRQNVQKEDKNITIIHN